jgi:hypothetical protein
MLPMFNGLLSRSIPLVLIVDARVEQNKGRYVSPFHRPQRPLGRVQE